MSLAVRTARPSDLDALVAIELAAFPGDRLTRRALRRLVASPSAEVELAVIGDRVAGYFVVLFRDGSRVARLYSLAVAPGVTGAGRRLLEAAEHAATMRGAGELRLEVRADNPRAIDLYARNGYRRVGDIPGYYEDGQTALRFRKMLRPETVSAAPPGDAMPSTGGRPSDHAASHR